MVNVYASFSRQDRIILSRYAYMWLESNTICHIVQVERVFIHQQQAEGIAVTKARRVQIGTS